MKIDRIASVICRGVWLLDPRIADGFMPSVARYLNGERVSWFDDDDDDDDDEEERILDTYCLSPSGSIIALKKGASGSIFSEAPQGSVAVIPISGTIMKNDYCGSPGTDTMASWLKDAYASENISAVIIKINSGGGSVEGTGEFAEVVSQANKPVVAYTDGLMASAAYWIGSAAAEIFASYETVEIGSIGTAINFYDNRKALEEWGYKQHYINADASVDKNQDYFKAIDGNYQPIKTHILNPTNDVFLNSVKRNREGKLVLTDVKHENGNTYQEPLTGQVYLAKKAIEIGLIDKIGSFEAAFERAQELASNPQSIDSLKNNSMFKINKFKSLTAIKGKKAEEVTAADVQAVNEEIEAEGIEGVTLSLDSDLANMAGENETASANVAALTALQNSNASLLATINTALGADSKETDLTAAVNALIASRDDFKSKADEYGSQPGALRTGGTKEGSDKIEGTDDQAAAYHSEADAELEEARKKAGITKKSNA